MLALELPEEPFDEEVDPELELLDLLPDEFDEEFEELSLDVELVDSESSLSR